MCERADLLPFILVVEITSLGLCTTKYIGENNLIPVLNSVIGKPVLMANMPQETPAPEYSTRVCMYVCKSVASHSERPNIKDKHHQPMHVAPQTC